MMKSFFSTLEESGEDHVRASLANNKYGSRTPDVDKWLNIQEKKREEIRDELLTREVEAAESADVSAKKSATSAEISARWAKIAAIAALIAIPISSIPLFK